MINGVSIDQLTAFVVSADCGSFSAAARRLNRAQSAVSSLVSSFEAQIGVKLFDRTLRYPSLTPAGAVLLADARSVLGNLETMKARAKGMSGGLEPELVVVVDVFFPLEAVTTAAKAFQARFPATPLRLYVEALGAVYPPVLDRRATLGIAGSLRDAPPGIVREALGTVMIGMLAAPTHALASIDGPIPAAELAKHVQLVLTDRSSLSEGRDFGVMSPLTWRLADMFAKHAFLLNGIGWGGMPLHAIRDDLEAGRLVQLEIEEIPSGGLALPMSAIYRNDDPPGPATRWFIEFLGNSMSTVSTD